MKQIYKFLSIQKTLWFLPNSHYYTLMKYHLINPYVLSCVGLLLGLRVTMCFWSTVRVANFPCSRHFDPI